MVGAKSDMLENGAEIPKYIFLVVSIAVSSVRPSALTKKWIHKRHSVKVDVTSRQDRPLPEDFELSLRRAAERAFSSGDNQDAVSG